MTKVTAEADGGRQLEVLWHLASALQLWLIPETSRHSAPRVVNEGHLWHTLSPGWFGSGGEHLISGSLEIIERIEDVALAALALSALGEMPWLTLPVLEDSVADHQVTSIVYQITASVPDESKPKKLSELVKLHRDLNLAHAALRAALYGPDTDQLASAAEKVEHILAEWGRRYPIQTDPSNNPSSLTTAQKDLSWAGIILELESVTRDLDKVHQELLPQPPLLSYRPYDRWQEELEQLRARAGAALLHYADLERRLGVGQRQDLPEAIRRDLIWIESLLRWLRVLGELQRGLDDLARSGSPNEIESAIRRLERAATLGRSEAKRLEQHGDDPYLQGNLRFQVMHSLEVALSESSRALSEGKRRLAAAGKVQDETAEVQARLERAEMALDRKSVQDALDMLAAMKSELLTTRAEVEMAGEWGRDQLRTQVNQAELLERRAWAMRAEDSARRSAEWGHQRRTFLRYGNVTFPRRTLVGQRSILRVDIAAEPIGPVSTSLPIERIEGGAPPVLDVLVRHDPSAMRLEGTDHRRIEVPFDAPSVPAEFVFTPLRTGTWSVIIEYFQAGRYLGRAWVYTSAHADFRNLRFAIGGLFRRASEMPPTPIPGCGPLPTSVDSGYDEKVMAQVQLALASRQQAPDLTILVDEVPQQGRGRRYRFTVTSSPSLGLICVPAGEIVLSEDPWTLFQSIYDEVNDWHGRTDGTNSVFFERLNSIGTKLYMQLFPRELRRLYWEHREQVNTLEIVSSEMWIPWELIRPYPEKKTPVAIKEDDFLCEKHHFTRWLAGYPAPDRLDLRTLRLVSTPAPNLDNLIKERDALQSLPGVQVEETVPPSLENVYAALKSGGFQGLHFACHGEADMANPDRSVLYLEGTDTLSPDDISGEKRTFGKAKPLVFVNACETRASGPGLTGLAGWAAAFIDAGASIFLGPAWEANDEAAYHFANEFYRNLLKGMPVGKATQAARSKIKQAGDPTWLSYIVYGDPWATLKTKKRICPSCERTLPYESKFCSDCGEVAPYLTQFAEVNNG